jgi:hypothetical protein
MATYFGYVEREADSYVNWADVGRNMSATIDNIQRVRDEKKALIEKAYREDLDYIQAIPSGEHKTLRDWSIGFGNDAAENLKLKYSLLKQGKSSVKDFTSFRENITNDTESLYTTINNIQTAYKEKMDRFKAGDNQDLEMADMAQLERFGNLSDTQSFINGLTGSVGIGLTEETTVDGKKVRSLKKGDDAYLTVQQLVAAVNRKYDNYDVIPDIAKWVEGFGEKIKSLRQFGSEIKAGSIIEVMDITNDELMKQATALGYTEDQITQIQKSIDDFKKSEKLYLESLMVDNPYNTLATLNKKLNYQPTFSKEEAAANDNMVYCERDASGAAVPKFTKDQTDAVFDYMKGQARLMYDEKVKLNMYNEPRKEVVQPRAPSAAEIEAGQENRTASAMGTYIRDIYSGNMAKKQETLKILQADGEVIPSQTYYKTGKNGEVFLHVTRKSDGESTDIKITNEDGTPYQDVVTFGRTAASWLYGGEISNKILMENQAQFDAALNVTPNFAPFDPNKKQNELWDRPAVKEEVVDPFIGIGNSIDKVDIFGSIQATAASDLKTALGGLGKQLTIKKSGTSAYGVGYDRVTVTAPNGEKIVLTTGYGSGTANKEAKDKEKGRLMTWLKENVKPELE